jgi:hypothetical protein
VFIIDPKKVIRTTLTYPASTGRNFDEILRVIDSLQLTDSHKVATPVNWKQGDDVVIVPSIQDPGAGRALPQGLQGREALPAHHAAAEQVSRQGSVAMQSRVKIVPGWRDSGPGHWQSLWEERILAARVPGRLLAQARRLGAGAGQAGDGDARPGRGAQPASGIRLRPADPC